MQMLTQTPIVEAIYTRELDQSPYAIELINAVRSITGADIVSCYAEFDTYLSEIPKQKNISNDFVHYSCLKLFIRDSSEHDNYDWLNKEIQTIFERFIINYKDAIDWHRSYTPEELQYYGWLNTPKTQWDNSKVITPKQGDKHSDKIEVIIESFDELARWHYMSDSLKTINSMSIINKLRADVKCGWDEQRNRMNLFVILPCEINDDIRDTLTRSMFAVVKGKDIWEVITNNNFTPIFKNRSSLSAQEMFNLLRG